METGLICRLTNWPLLVALGLFVGVSVGVGVGVVHAADIDYSIEEGLNYYPGPGSSNYTVVEEDSNYPGSFPNHKYKQLFKLEADADFPDATELDFSFGTYRYASGGSSGEVCFWLTRFKDEKANHNLVTHYWRRVAVDTGLNDARNISWEYDGFTASNKNMNVTQLMVVPAQVNGCDSFLTSQGMAHYTNWEVH